MTLLLSNQRLIVSVPGVCSLTLSQQTTRSPQRHGYASYPIGRIFSLKEYREHPPPLQPSEVWRIVFSRSVDPAPFSFISLCICILN